jgi:hypothetical protein
VVNSFGKVVAHVRNCLLTKKAPGTNRIVELNKTTFNIKKKKSDSLYAFKQFRLILYHRPKTTITIPLATRKLKKYENVIMSGTDMWQGCHKKMSINLMKCFMDFYGSKKKNSCYKILLKHCCKNLYFYAKLLDMHKCTICLLGESR